MSFEDIPKFLKKFPSELDSAKKGSKSTNFPQ
jgi:hypothetical protein